MIFNFTRTLGASLAGVLSGSFVLGGLATAAPAMATDRPVTNDLFSIDTTVIALSAGIGIRESGTSTFTAKRDIRVSSNVVPDTPTLEEGAKLVGTCPTLWTSVVMHAGDTCTLEYYFAPQSFYLRYGGGWNPSAVPIAANGTPEGDAVEASVQVTGKVLTLDFGQIDLGTTQVGEQKTVFLEVTNRTAIDLPVLEPAYMPGGLKPLEAGQFPVVIPAGKTVSIPLAQSPTWPGPVHPIFYIEAEVPAPSWGQQRPVSYPVNVTGKVTAAPLTVTDADFGTVQAGKTVKQTVTVTNTGTTWALIEAALNNAGTPTDIALSDFDKVFGPGESKEITVTWTPTGSSHLTGALGTITFNDTWTPADYPRTATAKLTGSRAPTAPVDPVAPTDPVTPTEPVTPTGPLTPSEPGTSTDVAPVAPTSLVTPRGNGQPTTGTSPEAGLAKTGANISPATWLVPLALIAAGGSLITLRLISNRRARHDGH